MRRQILREQASGLRDLSKLRMHEEHIRRKILELADKCDQLADETDQSPSGLGWSAPNRA